MNFHGWTLVAPADFVDHTVVVWSHSSEDINVTIGIDTNTSSLDAYVTAALTEIALQVGGRVEGAPVVRVVAGAPAREASMRGKSADGRALWQRQLFVHDGARVLVVTATGPNDQRAQVDRAFDGVADALARPSQQGAVE